ncbi:TPA: hypothetical protein R2K44_002369 [Raoultella ornithinolytica]|jgi:hypothetical protein|nr:hypothetical protein [Raoultella ornithinolytica]
MSKKANVNTEVQDNEEFILDSRLTCKQVVIFTSNEGGVQKSTNADKLVSSLREAGFRVAFFDADSVNAYSNHQKYQTNSNNNALKGCQSFDVDKNPELVIDAADFKADFIVFDMGANKMTEAVSGFGAIDKFFRSFDKSVQCTFAVPLSNDKCPRSFSTIYDWLEDMPSSRLRAKVRVASIINTGVMEQNADLLSKTMNAYNESEVVKSIKNETDKFEFIEVEQTTQYDTAGHVKALLKNHNVESAKLIVDEQSRTVRFILQDHFDDAERLMNAIIK